MLPSSSRQDLAHGIDFLISLVCRIFPSKKEVGMKIEELVKDSFLLNESLAVFEQQCGSLREIEEAAEQAAQKARRQHFLEAGHATVQQEVVEAHSAYLAAASQALFAYAKEAYAGQHGPGVLIVVYSDHNGTARIARILAIEDQDQLLLSRLKGESYILSPQKLQENQKRFSEDFCSCFCFEVGVAASKEEYAELYEIRKGQGDPILPLREMFPQENCPPLVVGEVFGMGGSSHHSGEISGYGVVLFTGGIAVVSMHDGDRGVETAEVWGAIRSPGFMPSWSGKHAELQNVHELDELTQEELMFLRGLGSKGEDNSAKLLALVGEALGLKDIRINVTCCCGKVDRLIQSELPCTQWYGMREGDREITLEEAANLVAQGAKVHEEQCCCFSCNDLGHQTWLSEDDKQVLANLLGIKPEEILPC